jgi:hypothetical protein
LFFFRFFCFVQADLFHFQFIHNYLPSKGFIKVFHCTSKSPPVRHASTNLVRDRTPGTLM